VTFWSGAGFVLFLFAALRLIWHIGGVLGWFDLTA
jgi:hypothetical protein